MMAMTYITPLYFTPADTLSMLYALVRRYATPMPDAIDAAATRCLIARAMPPIHAESCHTPRYAVDIVVHYALYERAARHDTMLLMPRARVTIEFYCSPIADAI